MLAYLVGGRVVHVVFGEDKSVDVAGRTPGAVVRPPTIVQAAGPQVSSVQ